jgi:putative oxidoreductase
MATARNNATTTLALTIIRVVTGWIFVIHGAQKVFDWGPAATGDNFDGMGVPMASVVGPVVAYLELVGGVALILGFLTRIVGGLLVLDMAGAAVLVHIKVGFFVAGGGYELVLLLGAASLALVVAGAGRWSLDKLLLRRG